MTIIKGKLLVRTGVILTAGLLGYFIGIFAMRVL